MVESIIDSTQARAAPRACSRWEPDVQRFVLQENIRRFRARLAVNADGGAESDEPQRLNPILASMERELALMDAAERGVRAEPLTAEAQGRVEAIRADLIAWFTRTFADSPKLAALVDPAPGLIYVAANASYHRRTGVADGGMIGRSLFELFPDNPDDPAAHGVHTFYESLRKVVETGRPDTMELLRYDVEVAGQGFRERYWLPVNTPLYDEAGDLVFLLVVATEATGEHLS